MAHFLFKLPQLAWMYLALGRASRACAERRVPATNIGGSDAPVLIPSYVQKLTLVLDRRSRSETTICAEGYAIPLARGHIDRIPAYKLLGNPH